MKCSFFCGNKGNKKGPVDSSALRGDKLIVRLPDDRMERYRDHSSEELRRLRPLARRLERTLRPFFVFIRLRKPAVRARFTLLG